MEIEAKENILERILITGMLVLEGPAHFGNGDASAFTDMPVLRDSETRQPMLTGASIAGALRSFASRRNVDESDRLFGKTNIELTHHSALCVDDAIGLASDTELRDGVALDPATRTAEANKKFDFEIIPQGTQFKLSFELTVCEGDAGLKETLADALHALQAGHILLGKRKTRGFGTCSVKNWRVMRYNLKEKSHVMAWLRHAESDLIREGADISTLLDMADIRLPAADFELDATFALDGSILIRSDATSVADTGHLQSRRNNEMKPVLSGTSLAGALRARALRIANTLAPDKGKAFVDGMFGPRRNEGQGKIALHMSRISVQETVIENGITDLVQQRVKIDRFTGGAFPGALFNQQPLFGKPETRVHVKLSLRKPRNKDDAEMTHNAEIGMALLLLKDMWTGDLPVGGEISAGRGRLRGLSAQVRCGETAWKIEQDSAGGLAISGGKTDDLNAYVYALKEALNK